MERLEVQKTYKLYINGAFPRTESGRYLKIEDSEGAFLANVCHGSRKDLRNAVEAARKAFFGWSQKTSFNRGQILYRMAEMLEDRKQTFVECLLKTGMSNQDSQNQVSDSIDLLVYYAGWADKYQQVFSSVNPVSGSYFNFSAYEPSGVITVFSEGEKILYDMIASFIPAITGGNSVVIIVNQNSAPCALNFAEVLATSDVPSGVVNIISSIPSELYEHAAGHLDINNIIAQNLSDENLTQMEKLAANNVKRIIRAEETEPSPYQILNTLEVKTTWHPIENISSGGSGY
jgi:acyl-CoA reductase-like NAD-dependent aldehyde dehydrogenase